MFCRVTLYRFVALEAIILGSDITSNIQKYFPILEMYEYTYTLDPLKRSFSDFFSGILKPQGKLHIITKIFYKFGENIT